MQMEFMKEAGLQKRFPFNSQETWRLIGHFIVNT